MDKNLQEWINNLDLETDLTIAMMEVEASIANKLDAMGDTLRAAGLIKMEAK